MTLDDPVLAPPGGDRTDAAACDQRATAILAGMTLPQKAGLLFHAMAQVPPGGVVPSGPDGSPFDPSTRTLIEAGVSHFSLMGPTLPGDIARWHNQVQEIAEQTGPGVPVTLSTDPRHGFVANPATGTAALGFSQWPEPLGLGAAADPELARAFGDVVRREFLAVGIRVLLGPALDLGTDPRWARTVGTFGADPELVTALGLAYIDGLRGPAATESVAAMIKHFPGGGPQRDGEDPHFDYGREQVYPGGTFDLHLAPFGAALTAGPVQVMPSYGMPVGLAVDGEPIAEVGVAFNRQLITGLLRERLGFDGVVCTDWVVVTDGTIFGAPMRARAWGVEHLDRPERVLAILDAGCDQIGGEAVPDIVVDLVRDGRLTEERVEVSARRILAEKLRLGLFDRRRVDVEAVADRVGTPAARRAGLDAQRRSVVVLDRGVLPLDAASTVYAEGLDPQVLAEYATVAATPQDADVVLVRVDAPFTPRTEGFENFFRAGTLTFPAEVPEHLAELAAHAPVVVDVFLDRPALLADLRPHTAALTATFGAGDRALLDVWFGRAPAVGGLPVEIPRSAADVARRREDVPFDAVDPLYPHRHPLLPPTAGDPA